MALRARRSRTYPPGWRMAVARWRVVCAATRQVRWPLGILCFFMAGGTVILWRGGGQPGPGHALMYVVSLITFNGSPQDMPDHPGLQVVSFGVMIGGVLSLVGGAARLCQLALDPGELQMALADGLRGHTIVCGVGKVGLRILEELVRSGQQVVAVNADERVPWLDKLQLEGVPVIFGDARYGQTLRKAGVAYARCVVACTNDDLANLDMALESRKTNESVRLVVRMFDPDLAHKFRGHLGNAAVLSTSEIAAPAFALAATLGEAGIAVELRDQPVQVATIEICAGSRFEGEGIQEVERDSACIFIARQVEESLEIIHDRSQRIQSGETYCVAGTLDALRRFAS